MTGILPGSYCADHAAGDLIGEIVEGGLSAGCVFHCVHINFIWNVLGYKRALKKTSPPCYGCYSRFIMVWEIRPWKADWHHGFREYDVLDQPNKSKVIAPGLGIIRTMFGKLFNFYYLLPISFCYIMLSNKNSQLRDSG